MSTSTTRARHHDTTSRRRRPPKVRALLEEQYRRQVADIVALTHDLPTSLAERREASRRGDLHVTARLIDAAYQQLEETEAALVRLDEGTYGRCVQCRQAVAPERLEVLPAARYCVACQAVKTPGRRS
jgi:RNA polymerase-binding transcription factor